MNAGIAPAVRRRREGRWPLALALAGGLAACGSLGPGDPERGWQREWNQRADAAAIRWENPCGDFRFGPWADAFLAACEPEDRLGGDECEHRRDWVGERKEQCQVWKAWLLRNHGQRVRRDDIPEPPTRVE